MYDEATEIYKYINDEFQKRDPIKQLKNEKISEEVARGELPVSYFRVVQKMTEAKVTVSYLNNRIFDM